MSTKPLTSAALALLIGAAVGGMWWYQQTKVDAPPLHALAPSPSLAPMPEWSLAEEPVVQRIKVLFQSGNYQTAAREIEAALTQKSCSATCLTWLKDQASVVFTSAGWVELRLSHCSEAVDFFTTALQYAARSETHKGLAVCLVQLKRLAQAAVYFEELQAQTGLEPELTLMFADTLESLARYEDAATTLAKTLAQKTEEPWTSRLTGELNAMKAKAREGTMQRQETSSHFQITYREGSMEEVAAWALLTLEEGLEEFCLVTGLKNPETPIEVVLYSSDEPLAHFSAGGPLWADGLFDGRMRLPATPVRQESQQQWGDRLRTTLRHELVHAMLATNFPQNHFPQWFEEGLAQWLASAGRAEHLNTMSAFPGDFYPAEAFDKSFITLGENDARRIYRQSLFLMRALFKSAQGEDILQDIFVGVSTRGTLSSKDLLAPAKMDFNALHKYAAATWKS